MVASLLQGSLLEDTVLRAGSEVLTGSALESKIT
jgi:hypothetical protein